MVPPERGPRHLCNPCTDARSFPSSGVGGEGPCCEAFLLQQGVGAEPGERERRLTSPRRETRETPSSSRTALPRSWANFAYSEALQSTATSFKSSSQKCFRLRPSIMQW